MNAVATTTPLTPLTKRAEPAGPMRKALDRVQAQGLLPTLGYYGGTVVLERLGFHASDVYRSLAPATDERPGIALGCVHAAGDFSAVDWLQLDAYGGSVLRREFERAFDAGEWCVVAREGDLLGSVCWIGESTSFVAFPRVPTVLIQRCFTFPEQRGRGLYSLALAFAARKLLDDDGERPVLVESSTFNRASIRGIEKAGFERIGYHLEWRGREQYVPSAN
jgi:hypothetical protein